MEIDNETKKKSSVKSPLYYIENTTTTHYLMIYHVNLIVCIDSLISNLVPVTSSKRIGTVDCLSSLCNITISINNTLSIWTLKRPVGLVKLKGFPYSYIKQVFDS